ncbi:MAG: aldo/keto reductase [Desulfobacteraceae bacterium]|nr:MAG: aldo/keto reductase [Desulfobacteraceae bacterium]
MQQRQIGRSGIHVSAVIMGTWQAGKAMWSGIDDNQTQRAMRAALDAGVTAFDTAEVYGNGHSERMVAKALSDVRDRIVLATKVFSNHLQYEQIIEACHLSLKNLNTHYIDLYQVHWPPGSFGHPAVPLEEIMRAMIHLKDQGKIRAIGVSNFNRRQMEEIAQYGPIESLQPPYSLFWRAVEREETPYCREKDMTILAYSPMAQGLLTGKFGPDHKFARGDHRSTNRLFQPAHFTRVQAAVAQLRPIADKYGLSLGQLALAWVIAQPGTCAIAGARNSEQATQNAAAGRISLGEEDLQAMDRIGRTVTDHLDGNPILWE